MPTVRQSARLALILPCLLLCSCMETPQKKLIGRWFNKSNSIRFTAEGHVRWNSPRGASQGYYTYDGSARRTSSSVPVRNLSLDLTRKGLPLLADFELEFLGDKLRLTPLSTANPGAIIVLKRAGEDDEETLIPLAEAPASNTTSQATVLN